MSNYAPWSQGSAAWGGVLFSPQLDAIEFARVFGDANAVRTYQINIDVYQSTSLDILVSVDGGISFSTFISAPSQGVASANLSLPIGEHSLVFKLSDDSNLTEEYLVVVSRFVILGTGQSNISGWSKIGGYPSLAPSASGYRGWLFSNAYTKRTMWAKWDSGVDQVDQVSLDEKEGDSWMIRFVNLMLAEYDEPIICIPACRGGRLVSEYQKDNTSLVEDGLNLYASAIKRVNEVGGATINIYQQGENDAVDPTLTPANVYKADLNQFANDIKADLGIDTLIIPLHHMTTGIHDGDGVSTGQVPIRQAQIEAADENENIFIAPPTTDIDVSAGDGLHFLTNAELTAVAQIAKTGYEAYLEGPIEVPNQPPVANAGQDQSVAAGVEFMLDGSGSQDTDGTIVEWRWTQTAGDPVILNTSTPSQPKATSPSRTSAQTLTFQLITVDDEGVESAPGTVNVNVAAVVLSEILKVIERLDFDLTTQGDVNAYFGRANREVMKLKPSDPTGLALDADGFMMLDSNTIEEVKVIAEGSSISSKTDSINLDGSEMLVRLGDLEASKNGNIYFSIVVFVEGDTKGVVVSSKGSSGNKPMSYVTL